MCEISSETKFSEKKSRFAIVAVEPFFSGSALDWNLSCFSNFSVAGDINVNMSSCLLNLDVICTADHVVGFTRPFHSVFAHSKRQKQEVGKACVRAEASEVYWKLTYNRMNWALYE